MGRRNSSKPAAASKAGPAKPSAAQQQEQDAKPGARPQTRKSSQKAAAAEHLDADSDPESLLGELGDDDMDWDPAAADSEDELLADELLAGLADELEASQDESDEEAAAHQPSREPKASAR